MGYYLHPWLVLLFRACFDVQNTSICLLFNGGEEKVAFPQLNCGASIPPEIVVFVCGWKLENHTINY